ncbi:MAG: A/G-specific adenine glycosylase [Hymenobacteraceae bacterium]|nr:A/G-specific adenine glycosylase [Hymenobacteraceae bacterium]
MPDYSSPTPSFFSSTLGTWYRHHHRPLPWRATRDPYAIWLSEVILQQTRVAQGLPYYERFLAAYPTVEALATAPEDDVLRHWQGLGYYARARNVHATAQVVATEFGGRFPTAYAGLLRLRGIGPYTAAAIASFAFGERVAVVDGNVFRVLARVFGIADDIARPATRALFQRQADLLIAVAPDPAEFNQAVMEFGAVQCTPARPDCLFCPFRESCFAFQHGLVSALPVKAKAKASPTRHLHYVVLRWHEQLYLRKRAAGDIWHGLYDLPSLETATEQLAPATLREQLGEWQAEPATDAARVAEPAAAYRHVLSHQKVAARFHEVVLRGPLAPAVLARTGLAAYSPAEIEALPKPRLLVQWLADQG